MAEQTEGRLIDIESKIENMAGAIPSSLHQKMKFIFEGKLITVFAEEGILLSSISIVVKTK